MLIPALNDSTAVMSATAARRLFIRPASGFERGYFSLLNADRTPRAAYTRIQQARASGYLPD